MEEYLGVNGQLGTDSTLRAERLILQFWIISPPTSSAPRPIVPNHTINGWRPTPPRGVHIWKDDSLPCSPLYFHDSPRKKFSRPEILPPLNFASYIPPPPLHRKKFAGRGVYTFESSRNTPWERWGYSGENDAKVKSLRSGGEIFLPFFCSPAHTSFRDMWARLGREFFIHFDVRSGVSPRISEFANFLNEMKRSGKFNRFACAVMLYEGTRVFCSLAFKCIW